MTAVRQPYGILPPVTLEHISVALIVQMSMDASSVQVVCIIRVIRPLTSVLAEELDVRPGFKHVCTHVHVYGTSYFPQMCTCNCDFFFWIFCPTSERCTRKCSLWLRRCSLILVENKQGRSRNSTFASNVVRPVNWLPFCTVPLTGDAFI